MSSSSEPRSEDGAPSTYEVRLAGSDVRFAVRAGERILGAGRRAGVWLPFECGWGSCGTCKVTLVGGEVALLYPEAPAVHPRDEQRRRTLTCQATAQSDLTLKVLRSGPVEERPTADYTAELDSSKPLGPDIRRFRFRLDAASDYRPGQYAILGVTPQVRRCYSMAGLPGSDHVDFIAKRYPGRPGSTALFGLAVGETIAMELPYGDMWLRPGERALALTAGGTGVSAILALLRQLVRQADPRTIHVFYGANTREELVCYDAIEELLQELPHSHLHGALLRPPRGWDGTSGVVTDAMTTMMPALVDADHYVAGPPVMVDAVLAVLRGCEVPVTRIHYDRFG